jgi:hypothetical protein
MRIEQIITAEQLEKLRKIGVLDEIAIRDHRIREAFGRMKLELGSGAAICNLARHHHLGVKAIDKIVYQSR